MAKSAFNDGVNFKGILWGAGFVLLALLAGHGASTGWHQRIGRVPLPAWALWLAVALALVVAVAFVVMSVNATFCAACGGAAVGGDAYLPLENEDQVMKAAESGDFKSLLSLPMLPRKHMKMAIWAAYCPKCEQAATVQVTRWKDDAPTTVMEKTEFTGPSAQAVTELIQRHEDWRGSEGGQDG